MGLELYNVIEEIDRISSMCRHTEKCALCQFSAPSGCAATQSPILENWCLHHSKCLQCPFNYEECVIVDYMPFDWSHVLDEGLIEG